MNKYLVSILAPTLLAIGAAQAVQKTTPTYEKFYGKVVEVDFDHNVLTVRNKKRQLESVFRWNGETAFIFRKNPIDPKKLEVGQNLIISFMNLEDMNVAKRITVRQTRKQKKPKK